MIRGLHAMFYSSEPDALRAFFRDIFDFKTHDLGHGWLIFDPPESDLGVHPAGDGNPEGISGTHNISFYCDNLDKTMAKLKAKGVEFTAPVADHGYGLVTHFKVPGGFEVQLYQPKYEKGPKAKPKKKKAKKPKVAKAKSGKKKKKK